MDNLEKFGLLAVTTALTFNELPSGNISDVEAINGGERTELQRTVINGSLPDTLKIHKQMQKEFAKIETTTRGKIEDQMAECITAATTQCSPVVQNFILNPSEHPLGQPISSEVAIISGEDLDCLFKHSKSVEDCSTATLQNMKIAMAEAGN